jgi:predicted transcriptional regulator
MPNYVYRILEEKRIKLSEEESVKLQQMWDFIQSYKKDYDQVGQNTDDIALRFIPKKGGKESD